MYLSRRQARVVQYVATRPLFQAATDSTRRTGSPYQRRFWWDQNVRAADADADAVDSNVV